MISGHRIYLVVKRVMDIIVSLAALLACFPLFILAVIAIKTDSPGPVFFLQSRVGKNGRIFRMFKFRSMYTGAEAQKEQLLHLNEVAGPVFKIKDDPRVTRTGRFLRKFSLDELPQLINIFWGEMSLVGPRPLPVAEIARVYPLSEKKIIGNPWADGSLAGKRKKRDTRFQRVGNA